ncbi:metallophosphoesterase [Nocardioides limicola]|uniref:metallophosphoesterase n=1 Tax=Nocardioides limicola TaxID=2803368 RepID=UPI00193C721A|nr:metallophosphoesterase [Nocardioides sp. DJM-14]
MTFTIAHLTDTHFGGLPGAAARTRRVLQHLAAMTPAVDVLLVTGDIADHGTDEEYAEAREVLGSWPGPAPMLLCPGNHDVREPYARLLRSTDTGGALDPGYRCDEVHDVGPARFVMLDSLISAPPGERVDPGELSAASLEFLAHALAETRAEAGAAGRPTYLCLHHPPTSVHVGLMDSIMLANPEALAEVIADHPQVQAILTGHAHTACATTFAGVPVLVGGGVASTVTLDAEDLPLVTDELPPMFAVHLVGDDGRVVTHWRAVPM